MGLIIKARNHRKISEPAEFQIEDFLNYQEMITYLGYFNPIEKVETEEIPKIKPEVESITIKPVNTPKPDIKQTGGFGNTVKKVFKAVVDFSNRHPVLTGIVKAVGVAGLAVANGGRSNSGNGKSDNYSYTPLRSGSSSFNDYSDGDEVDTADTYSYVEQSSLEEHMVIGFHSTI